MMDQLKVAFEINTKEYLTLPHDIIPSSHLIEVLRFLQTAFASRKCKKGEKSNFKHCHNSQ